MVISTSLVFICLALICFFSADAVLTNQKVHQAQKRGGMKLTSHSKAKAKAQVKSHAKKSKDDDDDDGDDDDDDDDDKDGDDADITLENEELQKELASNVRSQLRVKAEIKSFADKKMSDKEIDASVKQVSNETQSPAMAKMLGRMWKDMRMFETHSYSERLRGQLQTLKRGERSVQDELAQLQATHSFGSAACPCIGVDNVVGATEVTLKNGKQMDYPADIGARCEAWDLNRHPKCPGEAWCEQKWCYVDPCNCNIDILPKPSVFIGKAKFQGKPLHFSYATCGGSDSYTSEVDKEKNKKAIKAIHDTCEAKVNPSKWGHEDCRCVGVGPKDGHMKVHIKGKLVDFPADTGATCNKWEDDNHPDCQGKNPPDWCTQAWCYVDPCKCKLAVSPKTSSYLPGSNYQGKPVYYSYAACGGTDSYTSEEHSSACVNQKTASACGQLSKCAWNGKECMGKELVSVCKAEAKAAKIETEEAKAKAESGASSLTILAAVLLPVLGLVQ